MSWSIKIVVTDDKPVLTEPIYPPPPGTYVINGHTDDVNETITATRFAADGGVLVQATGTARKVNG